MNKIFTPNRELFIRIVFPLITLSVLTYMGHIYLDIDSDGWLVNLSSELIGILITIWFVDYVLKKSEADKWKILEKRIVNWVQYFVNESLMLLTIGLNLPSIKPFNGSYINERNNILASNIKERVKPRVSQIISDFKEDNVENFLLFINEISILVDKLFLEFGDRLPNYIYENFIDLRDILYHTTGRFKYRKKFNNSNGYSINVDKTYLNYLEENTINIIDILLEIDVYLRDNYGYIPQNWQHHSEELVKHMEKQF